MPAENVFISVIIPAFNAESFLVDAVNSVLGQSYRNFELIIVNDGSLDLTSELIADIMRKDSRVRSVTHVHNRGLPATRNSGIKAAKGEWIAFLDADDKWLPEKLSEQVDIFA